jgi:hypothetical protein
LRAEKCEKISTLNLLYAWVLLDVAFSGICRIAFDMDVETAVERWGGYFSLGSLCVLAVVQRFLRWWWSREVKVARARATDVRETD